MPLPYMLDSRDGIPEGMEDHYSETDEGKFQLSLEGANFKTQQDIEALETVVSKERKLRREAEKKAKQLPEDFDQEEWEELKALKSKQSTGKSTQKDDEKIQRLENKYNALLDEKDTRIQSLTKNLETRLIDNGLAEELRKNGITNDAYLAGAKALLKSEVKTIEEDGELIAVGGPAEKDLATFVSEWVKTDIGKSYASAKDTTGGGTRKASGNLNDFSNVKSKADLKTRKQKSAFVKEFGFEEFEKLPTK